MRVEIKQLKSFEEGIEIVAAAYWPHYIERPKWPEDVLKRENQSEESIKLAKDVLEKWEKSQEEERQQNREVGDLKLGPATLLQGSK